MTLAREIVALDAKLRDTHPDLDLFGAAGRKALGAHAAAASLVRRLEVAGVVDPFMSLVLALQTARIQRCELEPRLLDAEFVATVPGEVPEGARPTSTVLREMFEDAASEIVALGYEVTDADVLGQLSAAARRGVAVTLLCDRQRATEKGLSGLDCNAGVDVYFDEPQPDDARYTKMHCKCLVVDGNDVLITSANFTFHGLHGNFEFGVRLRGGPASEARRFVERLVHSGFFRKLGAVEIGALT